MTTAPTTQTLAEFLTRRLDEDEAAARAAADDVGRVHHHLGWRHGQPDTPAEKWDVVSYEYEGIAVSRWEPDADRNRPRSGWWRDSTEDHIARHDPARVLADVAAKREIVADFRQLCDDYAVTHDPTTEARRHQALVAISHLASVYAEHAEYRSEWAP